MRALEVLTFAALKWDRGGALGVRVCHRQLCCALCQADLPESEGQYLSRKPAQLCA